MQTTALPSELVVFFFSHVDENGKQKAETEMELEMDLFNTYSIKTV